MDVIGDYVTEVNPKSPTGLHQIYEFEGIKGEEAAWDAFENRLKTENQSRMSTNKEIEEGTEFTPRFDQDGLIPCITISASGKDVLMMAWMNEEALDKTLETGEMHYWSRSRSELWHKGATSGFVQKVVELRTDCDQDCILAHVAVTGEEKACHTDRPSCFYRKNIQKSGWVR